MVHNIQISDETWAEWMADQPPQPETEITEWCSELQGDSESDANISRVREAIEAIEFGGAQASTAGYTPDALTDRTSPPYFDPPPWGPESPITIGNTPESEFWKGYTGANYPQGHPVTEHIRAEISALNNGKKVIFTNNGEQTEACPYGYTGPSLKEQTSPGDISPFGDPRDITAPSPPNSGTIPQPPSIGQGGSEGSGLPGGLLEGLGGGDGLGQMLPLLLAQMLGQLFQGGQQNQQGQLGQQSYQNSYFDEQTCSQYAYEPVCGTNGQTYFNQCMADRSRVNIAKKGQCVEQTILSTPNAVTQNILALKDTLTTKLREAIAQRIENIFALLLDSKGNIQETVIE